MIPPRKFRFGSSGNVRAFLLSERQSVKLGMRLFVALAIGGALAAAAPRQQAPGRLQEGSFSDHFNGRSTGTYGGDEVTALRAARLVGTCSATLMVYSGRADPTIRLSSKVASDVWMRIRLARPSPRSSQSRAISGGLGYSGIALLCDTEPATRRVVVRCGNILSTQTTVQRPISYVAGLDRSLLGEFGRVPLRAYKAAYVRACEPLRTRDIENSSNWVAKPK